MSVNGQPIIIVKKKGGHGGAHGAAWKVAYADFVTAMMALFIVLWLLSQTDQNFKKELSQYFRSGVFQGAPSLLDGGSGVLDKGYIDTVAPSVAQPVIEYNAEMIEQNLSRIVEDESGLGNLKDNVRISVTPEGVLIEFIDDNKDLLFDLSSSELKPPLVRVLSRLAPILANAGLRVRIQGHTDARPFPKGSTRNNWSLSYERADRARRILEQNGLPPEQLIGILSHGANVPLDRTNPGAAQNRRLSLLAVPTLERRGGSPSAPREKPAPVEPLTP